MIRVWHSIWNEQDDGTDKFSIGHTDMPEGYTIDTDGEGVLFVKAQNARVIAAFNRWDRAELILPDSTKLKPSPPPMPGEQPLPLDDEATFATAEANWTPEVQARIDEQLAGPAALVIRRSQAKPHLTL